MKNAQTKAMVWLATRVLGAMSLALTLTACFEEAMEGVSYQGANHTDVAAMYVSINGEGGIMIAQEHGYSGNICCVNVPQRWRPGLTVTVGWQDEGSWLLDESGKEVIRNGKTVLVPAPRKSKTVEIPEYTTPETLWIHFFPNDEVKVVMSKYGPAHAKHPIANPKMAERIRRDLAIQESDKATAQNNSQKP